MTRNSTGNIYEQLLRQFDSEQGKYIRGLVNKNQKTEDQSATTDGVFFNRRKSYADLQPVKEDKEQPREQRQTLCKAKFVKENGFSQQMTPKNTGMTRSDFIKPTSAVYPSVDVSSFIKKEGGDPLQGKTFIDSLTCYLQKLGDTAQHVAKPFAADKLGDTLKITSKQDSHSLASKLEQSLTKIKELKLKNHFLEKELNKYSKRERKMKECLYQMLEEIKQMSGELARERRQRKRLQKIVETFEFQSQKGERKTIGKVTKIQQFQMKINQFSENQERTDLDSSFPEMWKYSSVNSRKGKSSFQPHHDRQFSYMQRGILDSNKIDEMFMSKHHSEDEDSCE